MEIDKVNELEQLREQMSLLKEKLDNQEIVNDRLISVSMKKKMSWIKKFIFFEVAIIPVIGIVWAGIVYVSGISWLNLIVLMMICIADVYADYRINLHAMNDSDYEKCNLVETTQKLVKMKHQRFIQMVIGVPLVLLWFVWFSLDVYCRLPSVSSNELLQSTFIGGMVGGVIGCVIGVCVALYLYKKMQKTNDNIIKQINDIMGVSA